MRWNATWSAVLRSRRLVWSVCGILVLATFLGIALVAWDLRSDTLKDYQRDNRSLGLVLAEQTSRYLQVIDLEMQEVAGYGATADGSPAAFRARFANVAAHDFLSQRMHNLPQAHALAVIGADGRMLASSRSFPPPDIQVADRDYFRHFQQHPGDRGLFISAPTMSRVSHILTLYAVRGVEGPDHAFLGIVVAAIDIAYLSSFYGAIDLQAGRTVTILRRDGLILVRYPDQADATGRFLPAASHWYARVAAGGGTYSTPGFLSSGPALVSVHPLQHYKLVVDTAIMIDPVLAEWRKEALRLGIGAMVGATALVVLFSVIATQFRRLATQNTTLAEAAVALQESERRVRDFAEVSSDWFWEQDARLRFTWLSQTSPTEKTGDRFYQGKSRHDLVRADPGEPRWAEHQADLVARRPFRDFRYQRATVDGGVMHISTSGVPVFDAEGRFVGYRGTGRDITAQVRAEGELRQAKEDAEAASRTKSEFLATMSHELRTPLNAIIGFSELIRDQSSGPLPPGYVDFAKEIHTGGRHLLDLINDMLDLSKIESGHYELHEEALQLLPLLRSCVGMLGGRAREGDVRLVGDLPDRGVALRADRRAVRQVLLNLLENAAKFTPAGGSVTLAIDCRAGAGLAVMVRDSGIGIDPAKLAELGEPFHQADASINRRFGGSGLGLAITRRLLVLHGGRLEIHSRPGEGTTVRAIFPADRVVVSTESALS